MTDWDAMQRATAAEHIGLPIQRPRPESGVQGSGARCLDVWYLNGTTWTETASNVNDIDWEADSRTTSASHVGKTIYRGEAHDLFGWAHNLL